ncbi:MAG: hypothetical protein BWY76_00336 [bacterium ADurb.Bin429]|nr:MAG: hypothetical protein BWY76_00336 [bacterium ADurb.Bin429]
MESSIPPPVGSASTPPRSPWKIILLVLAALVGLGVVIAGGFALLVAYAFSYSPSASQHIPSKDGKYILVTSVITDKANPQYTHVTFTVQDAAGKTVFSEVTGASDRMKWRMYWGDNYRIWLNSSDIGSYCWDHQPGGIWKPR